MKIKALVFIICLFSIVILCFYAFKKRPSRDLEYDKTYKVRLDIFNSSPPNPGSTIFLGDSQTQKFEISEYIGSPVKNRGINSDDTEGVLRRISEIKKHTPKKVFLEIGINDIRNGVIPEKILSNIGLIFKNVKEGNDNVDLYMISIFPVSKSSKNATSINKSVKDINYSLKEYCSANDVKFINLHSAFQLNNALNPIYDTGDNLHINGKAYRIWADSVVKFLTIKY